MPGLTQAQLLALKTSIFAQTDLTFVGWRNEGATGLMAEWYNAPSTFTVWRTVTPLTEVADAITWAAFTPTDAPDGTAAWQTKALACQGYQFNVQNMLLVAQQFGGVSSGRAKVRQGWQDSTQSIPSGVGGVSQSAGWAQIRLAMQRAARRGEALYATGTGTVATPGTLVYEGQISDQDVILAINS